MALTADAVHDWATWALLATRVPFQLLDPHGRHRSLPRWRRVPLIATALGRPHHVTLSEAHATFLDDLDDWHRALSYADPHARDRLCRRLDPAGADRRAAERDHPGPRRAGRTPAHRRRRAVRLGPPRHRPAHPELTEAAP